MMCPYCEEYEVEEVPQPDTWGMCEACNEYCISNENDSNE
jgi:hypothetical protein